MYQTFLDHITAHYCQCHSQCHHAVTITMSGPGDVHCVPAEGRLRARVLLGRGRLLCSVHVSPPHSPPSSHLTSQAFLVSRPRPSIDQQTLAWAHTSPAPGLLSNLPHSKGIKISLTNKISENKNPLSLNLNPAQIYSTVCIHTSHTKMLTH